MYLFKRTLFFPLLVGVKIKAYNFAKFSIIWLIKADQKDWLRFPLTEKGLSVINPLFTCNLFYPVDGGSLNLVEMSRNKLPVLIEHIL